jgi:hypothetical protein
LLTRFVRPSTNKDLARKLGKKYDGRAYVVSVHGHMKGSIASMPSWYPLTPRNLHRLWEEVTAHWQKLDAAAKVSAFTYEEGAKP